MLGIVTISSRHAWGWTSTSLADDSSVPGVRVSIHFPSLCPATDAELVCIRHKIRPRHMLQLNVTDGNATDVQHEYFRPLGMVQSMPQRAGPLYPESELDELCP